MVVIDRLHELKVLNNTELFTSESIIKSSALEDAGDLDELQKFVASCQNIKDRIKFIHEEIKKLQLAYQLSLSEVSESKELIDEIGTRCNTIRNAIFDVKSSFNRQYSEYSEGVAFFNPHQNRIRANKLENLRESLRTCLTSFTDIEAGIRKRQQERLSSKILVVMPDVSPEKLADFSQNPSLISDEMLFDAHTPSERQTLALILEDLRMRHADVLKLESSIYGLHQMFQELSVLIIQQGELIEQIVESTENVEHYTEKSTVVMKSAIKKAKSKRKYYIILVIVVCIFVLFAIGYFLRPFLMLLGKG